MTELTGLYESHDWWLDVGVTESWAYQHKLFTGAEIDQIHDIAAEYKLQEAAIGAGDSMSKDKSVRDSNISFLSSSDAANQWIFQRITRSIIDINQQFWNFDLQRIETLQYSEYGVGQFYKQHIDMMYQSPTRAVRKLSFTVQLTDPEEYEGGEVLIKHGTDSPIHKDLGTISFFPSYILHEVTPITKGTRHALVGWVTGPAFK